MKKIIITFLMICLAALPLCSCSGGGEEPAYDDYEATEGSDGTITLHVTDFDTFNPIVTRSESVLAMSGFIYDGLFEREYDLSMRPALASGYTVSEDGLLYTVQLRDDIVWQNGKSFSSADVVYTLNAITECENSTFKSKISPIESYEASGNLEVRFKLFSQMPNFINHLDFPIILENTPYDSVDSQYVPMGTAAYCASDKRADRILYLKPYEKCKTSSSGEIKDIIIKTLPSYNDVTGALELNEIEAINADSEMLLSYSPKGNIKTVTYPNDNIVFLGINRSAGILSELSVRKAISAFADRDLIVKNGAFGRGIPAYTLIRENTRYYPKNFSGTVGLDEAKTMLEKDGWTFSASNKYERVSDSQAEKLCFKLLVNGESTTRVLLAEQIKKNLEAKGIDVIIENPDFETYRQRVIDSDYEAFLGETKYGDDYDLSVFLGRYAKYSVGTDENMYALFSLLYSAKSEEEVNAAYEKIIDLAADTLPVIPLFFGQNAIIASNRINVGENTVCRNITGNFSSWSTN